MTKQETKRIYQELKTAGVTSFGMVKFAVRHLPHILHEGEHIKGAVYGRYEEDKALMRWAEGMLIATDRRVIFLDRKPGFEVIDEFTYDVVSGVQKTYAWPFASLTLHTRIGNYTLRFANQKCIDTFMHYVEKRRLETNTKRESSPQPQREMAFIDDQAENFLNNHDIAVLSTVDRSGTVHGAAVHYHINRNKEIHILTKADTQKARNIFANKQAALTLYDQSTMQTLQIQGMALPEIDQAKANTIFVILSGQRVYGGHLATPPVTSLSGGAYTVLRIIPYIVHLSDFGRKQTSFTAEEATHQPVRAPANA